MVVDSKTDAPITLSHSTQLTLSSTIWGILQAGLAVIGLIAIILAIFFLVEPQFWPMRPRGFSGGLLQQRNNFEAG
jgi:hypothetical protein